MTEDRMSHQMELNDLAMLWVQQEPDDAAGVSRILQSLVAFSEHAGLHASVKDQISKTIEILNAMPLLEADSLADAWSEAGTCVERAIQLMEHPDEIQIKST